MRRAILNEQWLNGYVVNCNLPIGAPMAWLSEVPPVGFLAFDGSEYNQEDFPELYEVVKNIPSFHSDTAGKFKIPNLKGRVLQGADTVIGELIEAGLPNIIGEVKNNDPTYGSIQMVNPNFEGAFSGQFHGNAGWSGSVYGCHTLKIDARKGETKTDGTLKTQDEPHVYGNSDTVQMDAFTVYWVIKATNYVSLEKNAIDDTKTTKANAWSAEKTKAEIETVDNKFNFSTDEIIVGKWIDGKNIYRKVIDVRNNGLGVTSFIINVTDLNIDYLVNSNVLGSEYNNYGGNKWVISCVTDNGVRDLYLEGVTQNIRGKSNEYMHFAILEYTKTTD